jgi:nicotinate-nucleotide--dimethylbenzimidazole phosphoribosyltransferase
MLGDHVGLLATSGGSDLAAAVGVLLQSAARRTPVLLDGLVAAAAALLAQRVAFRAVDWWLAAARTAEPAQDIALDRLSLEPLLDLGVAVGEGVGALTAVPLLQVASRLLSEAEPYDEAVPRRDGPD